MLKYIIISLLITTNFLFAKADYIEATGYGNTKEQALKSAFSDAVSQYIGVLVDSKSITKNGKLIEDKILTFSNGYIKDYKVLKSFQRVGLWQVTVNALVKEQDVMDKIIKEKISSKDIKNSNQRYAKLVSQIKTKFEAEDILVATMKDILIWDTTKKYNVPKITAFNIDEDGATRKYVPVFVQIDQSLNKTIYTNILNRLRPLFKKLGGKKYKRNKPNDMFTTIKIYDDESNFSEYWKFPNSYKVIYPFISKRESGSWHEYLRDGEVKTSVSNYKNYDKYYVLNFLDSKGSVLFSKKLTHRINTGKGDQITYSYATLKPFSKNGDRLHSETYKIPLSMIKDLSRVEVKWVD